MNSIKMKIEMLYNRLIEHVTRNFEIDMVPNGEWLALTLTTVFGREIPVVLASEDGHLYLSDGVEKTFDRRLIHKVMNDESVFLHPFSRYHDRPHSRLLLEGMLRGKNDKLLSTNRAKWRGIMSTKNYYSTVRLDFNLMGDSYSSIVIGEIHILTNHTTDRVCCIEDEVWDYLEDKNRLCVAARFNEVLSKGIKACAV